MCAVCGSHSCENFAQAAHKLRGRQSVLPVLVNVTCDFLFYHSRIRFKMHARGVKPQAFGLISVSVSDSISAYFRIQRIE